MSGLKRSLLRLILAPGVSTLLSPFRRDRASVFMLHRFSDPARGVQGHDPAALRAALDHLRRHRYDLVSLEGLFKRLGGDGPPLRKAVAFTIDDGYLDHATVAAPIFAEFDCPVTTFVTTGFLDGQLWFWWDRIEYVFQHTARRAVQVTLGPEECIYTWTAEAERARAQSDFTERCKRVPDAEKLAGILRLADAAEVALPSAPPLPYVPMSWDQLRACEAGGMNFGPHTVTHPVLSRATDEQSRREIADSWARLGQESRQPVPVFCYPNGGNADFGEREIRTLQEQRFLGAVVGEIGPADVRRFGSAPDAPYRVRRFPWAESLVDVVQVAAGLEGLKQAVRRER